MSKNRKTRHRKSRLRRSRSSWWTKLLLLGAGAAILVVVAVCVVYGVRSMRYDVAAIGEMPERSTVYDMNGNVYHRLYGENRIKVSVDQVSPNFIKALLAREDSRFYDHDGVDYIGIARAVVRNATSMSAREGASTLTQQLARNSFPLGGQTLDRKILEAFVAKRIESKYDKKQILEFYVNRIYYGSGLYGIETASQAYFGKPSAKLTLGEGALLAGIIRSPNPFSPFKNMDAATRERDMVLDRMVHLKMISPEESKAAKTAKIAVMKRKAIAQENYFMDAVRRDLDILLSDTQVDEGGLKIYTTIDPDLQKTAEQTLESHLSQIERKPGFNHPKKSQFSAQAKADESPTPYLQGSVVVIDNRSGAIRAIVGGRDYAESKYNRALLAKRQVGSSFKPFVYAAAFQRGMMPGMVVDDGPLHPGEVQKANNWNPANSDGTYGGYLPAAVGLIRSRNTMSIRVGEWAGLEYVRKTAMDVGLGEIPNMPVVYLGAFEATLKDLTAAYSVFPNGGERKQSYIIERIDDAAGNPIYRAAHIEAASLPPGPAWLTSRALEQVFQSGTATSAKSLGFNKPAGGKTGTTNDYRDAWFLGYTSTLTCGVWVGLDNPQTIMGRGYGATLALPVWAKVMSHASAKRYPADPLTAKVPVREVTLCSYSNELATAGCQYAGSAYSATVPLSMIPQQTCTVHTGREMVGPTDPYERDRRDRDSFGDRVSRSIRRFFGD